MARDYKHRKRRKKQARSGSGFVTGLTCGLAVALLVHLYHAGRVRPPAVAPSPARTAAPLDEPAGEIEDRFEFYDILPEFEVPVPVISRAGGGTIESPQPLPPGSYYLQAGSFRSHADADRRKANLALLGVSSTIQRVSIDGGQTWFRVRVGPIREPAELDALRGRLETEGIQTLTVRGIEAP